ncbi:acyl-CoA carboxylase epsilon subunit [Streptomyces sp. NPDC050147]|uniref:acyl-CoA carboxylase epsilon subunit n=1 Tax=Streptomyces sp. NPDC050147 TaxID=3155513 RepID=UPI00341ACA19
MTGTEDTALTVVRGRPDDLELAALTAVLKAIAQQAGAAASPAAPGSVAARWEGDGCTRPAGSWRSGGGHRPGPAGRARAMA